jgi:hypothetical protein
VTETNVFHLSQPGSFIDPLTEVLRDGARALLAQAVEAEVATLLSRYTDERTNDGRQRLVRHGHLPEREIMTGIGRVAVRCPRVRDRVGEGSERIRFSSGRGSGSALRGSSSGARTEEGSPRVPAGTSGSRLLGGAYNTSSQIRVRNYLGERERYGRKRAKILRLKVQVLFAKPRAIAPTSGE